MQALDTSSFGIKTCTEGLCLLKTRDFRGRIFSTSAELDTKPCGMNTYVEEAVLVPATVRLCLLTATVSVAAPAASRINTAVIYGSAKIARLGLAFCAPSSPSRESTS
jgi:hypothetical protein